MSDITDRIAAHFDSLGKRTITVPEWGLTFCTTPVTIAERSRIYKNNKGDNDFETVVQILIVKAKDEAGVPLFTIADKPGLLNHTDSTVLVRVAAEIMANISPDATELKS